MLNSKDCDKTTIDFEDLITEYETEITRGRLEAYVGGYVDVMLTDAKLVSIDTRGSVNTIFLDHITSISLYKENDQKATVSIFSGGDQPIRYCGNGQTFTFLIEFYNRLVCGVSTKLTV